MPESPPVMRATLSWLLHDELHMVDATGEAGHVVCDAATHPQPSLKIWCWGEGEARLVGSRQPIQVVLLMTCAAVGCDLHPTLSLPLPLYVSRMKTGFCVRGV
jgi:hypothetical protein